MGHSDGSEEGGDDISRGADFVGGAVQVRVGGLHIVKFVRWWVLFSKDVHVVPMDLWKIVVASLFVVRCSLFVVYR